MSAKKAGTSSAGKTKLTVTNAEAVKYMKGLRALNELHTSLPVLIGYRVLQNIHALDAALLPMAEAEKTIFSRYSNGKPNYVLKKETDPDAFEKCMAELSELDEIQIEVDIVKISIDQIKNCELPLSAIFALDFMLEGREV